MRSETDTVTEKKEGRKRRRDAQRSSGMGERQKGEAPNSSHVEHLIGLKSDT